MLKTENIKIRCTLIEPMLGSKSSDVDMFTKYVAIKSKDEVKILEEVELAKNTDTEENESRQVFTRDHDGDIVIFNYQVKGFLKEAGECIRKAVTDEDNISKGKAKKWGMIKGKIDDFVNVYPRKIKLGKKDPDLLCNRILNGMTMQGKRTTPIESEAIDAGSSFECEIKIIKNSPVKKEMIYEILNYGKIKGFGQWRNAGNGIFFWELLKETEEEL